MVNVLKEIQTNDPKAALRAQIETALDNDTLSFVVLGHADGSSDLLVFDKPCLACIQDQLTSMVDEMGDTVHISDMTPEEFAKFEREPLVVSADRVATADMPSTTKH